MLSYPIELKQHTSYKNFHKLKIEEFWNYLNSYRYQYSAIVFIHAFVKLNELYFECIIQYKTIDNNTHIFLTQQTIK
eukprot:GAHX01001387.1.p1 GENE.GAHX01001387.1~~GAHX01001387.1.p1  ORF type:complete len:77 (-),score=7.16 GAHX01001387.1:461-691(-)